jgi:hypothetical protein
MKKTQLTSLAIVSGLVLGLTACSPDLSTDSGVCQKLDSVAAASIKKSLAGEDYSSELKNMYEITSSVDPDVLSTEDLRFGLASISLSTNPGLGDIFNPSQVGEGIAYMRVACKDAGFPWVESEKLQ